jgi:hypothetical protein
MADSSRLHRLRSYRARSWLRAAGDADSLDARFIFLWVAFNSLYGQRRAHDWLDVEAFLRKVLHSDAERVRKDLLDLHDEGIALLGLEFLSFGYWGSGFTDLVAETITGHILQAEFDWAAETPHKSLVPIFERLYVLRNQVFHGSAKFGSSKNRDSLRPAVPAIAATVSRAITTLSMGVPSRGDPCFGPGRLSVRGIGKWRRRHMARRRAASIPWTTSAPGVRIAGARTAVAPAASVRDRTDGRS